MLNLRRGAHDLQNSSKCTEQAGRLSDPAAWDWIAVFDQYIKVPAKAIDIERAVVCWLWRKKRVISPKPEMSHGDMCTAFAEVVDLHSRLAGASESGTRRGR